MLVHMVGDILLPSNSHFLNKNFTLGQRILSRYITEYTSTLFIGPYSMGEIHKMDPIKWHEHFIKIWLLCPGVTHITFSTRFTQMLIWYFSNNLVIYNYVGKLPEQHFSAWVFSNPGDNLHFFCWNFMKPGSQSGISGDKASLDRCR